MSIKIMSAIIFYRPQKSTQPPLRYQATWLLFDARTHKTLPQKLPEARKIGFS
jgi:hypothetical protein